MEIPAGNNLVQNLAKRFTYHLNSVETPREWVTTDIPSNTIFSSYPEFEFIPGSRGDAEPIRYGDFILDLDDKSDVIKTVQGAKIILGYFEKVYGIAPDAWLLYLSGAKGVHLVLSAEVLGTEGGHKLLPLIYKHIALELEGDTGVKVDLSLYCLSTGRPFRNPNTRRENKLYKVPITSDELQELSGQEDYKQFCSAPRDEPARPAPEKNDALAFKVQAYTAKAEEAVREKSEPLDDEATAKLREKVPACIAAIVKATTMPKRKPTFNAVAMQLIGYAVTAELSEAETIQLCDPAIRCYPSQSKTPYAERLREFKTRYRHMSAYGKGFSCAGVLALGFPGFDCKTCLLNEKGPASTATKELGGPIPLPDELLQVAPFNFTLLPETLRPWAEDISERIQCPPDFVGIGIMTGLAAVLGRKIAIRPQEHTDWTVIANQWGLVVGRPGVLKSPAIEATLTPIKRLAALAAEQHAANFEEYKKNQVVAKLRAETGEKAVRKRLEKDPGVDATDLFALFAVDDIAVPAMRRYIANDTSPASLGELLRQNQNGLLVYRDELVSLLKGLDREDQAEGRGFYLTGWNGDSSYTFDRIGRGLNLHIEAVCLSVLGGTQPGRLAEYIGQAVRGGAGDDGLIQRFGLLVWPDNSGTWKDVDRWPDNEAKNAVFRIYEHLDNIDPASIGALQDTDLEGKPDGPAYLRLSPAGLGLFQEWRTDLETRLRSGELHPALESHIAKYRKLVPGLALIIHLADSGIGPVTETAILKALAWGEYLETHAKRAYGAISQPDVSTAKAILARIRKGNLPTTFSNWQVWRPGWAQLSGREQVSNGLRLLVDYGWLREERLETGGRPATVYHLIEGGAQ